MVYTVDICGVECRRDEETKFYYINEFINRFNHIYKTNFMTFEEFTESDYYKAIEEEEDQDLAELLFETEEEYDCLENGDNKYLVDIDMIYLYLYSVLYDKKLDNELAEYLDSYGYYKSKCLVFN